MIYYPNRINCCNDRHVATTGLARAAWFHLAVAAAIMMSMNFNSVGPNNVDSMCNDVPEALDYLHDTYLSSMKIEDKCKVYAIVAFLLGARGRVHRKYVTNLLSMHEVELNRHYEKLQSNDELGKLYMLTIDTYRASSHLGVPFLDLVECLKLIDKPYAWAYLDSAELKMIIDLYRRILEAPDTKIDLKQLDLTAFHPSFEISLKHLFRKHLQKEDLSDGELYLIDESDEEPQGGEAKTEQQQSTEAERALKRREQRRKLAAHRHREQERLRKQRRRILKLSTNPGKALRERYVRNSPKNMPIRERRQQRRLELQRAMRHQRREESQQRYRTTKTADDQHQAHHNNEWMPIDQAEQGRVDVYPTSAVAQWSNFALGHGTDAPSSSGYQPSGTPEYSSFHAVQEPRESNRALTVSVPDYQARTLEPLDKSVDYMVSASPAASVAGFGPQYQPLSDYSPSAPIDIQSHHVDSGLMALHTLEPLHRFEDTASVLESFTGPATDNENDRANSGQIDKESQVQSDSERAATKGGQR